jgi:formate C-acetyltransferase
MPACINYVAIDYAKLLRVGLCGIIDEARTELRNLRFTSAAAVGKADFLHAVIVSHEAVASFARRYAGLGERLSLDEQRPARRDELQQIAETCNWISEKPPRSFHEALQLYWFFYIILSSGVTPLGRFDQLLFPFYERDRQYGRLDEERALELLQCLRIKDMQINTVFVRAAQRAKRSGRASDTTW